MTFLKNINYFKNDYSTNKIEKLLTLYNESMSEEDFPFTIALQTFNNLKKTAETKEEFLGYLLEDIVFSSLYATYYEQILITIRENHDIAHRLINVFEENASDREQIISEQTDNHIQYIKNNGFCKGCKDCGNHGDLDDLLSKWNLKQNSFFINLYLGMQTIQNSMEQLLYDFLIDDPSLSKLLTIKNVVKYRKYIYEHTQEKIKEIS